MVLVVCSCHFNTRKDESKLNTSTAEVNIKKSESSKISDKNHPPQQIESTLRKTKKTNKSIYILDSLKLSLDLLIDTASKYNPNLPVIHPAELSDDLTTVFFLDDSTLLISFFIDRDYEEMRFTKWSLKNNSSLKYQGRLVPDFMTKYSYVTILEQIKVNERKILIGETSGEEGGGFWQTLQVSELNERDSLIKMGQYETGYADGDNIMSLEYQIKGNDILIFEKTDSINYIEDSLVLIPLVKEQVKTIKLEGIRPLNKVDIYDGR